MEVDLSCFERCRVDGRAILILFIRHSAKREGGRQAQDEDDYRCAKYAVLVLSLSKGEDRSVAAVPKVRLLRLPRRRSESSTYNYSMISISWMGSLRLETR